jgi:hypothetical protein
MQNNFSKLIILLSRFPEDAYSSGDNNHFSKHSLKNILNPTSQAHHILGWSVQGGWEQSLWIRKCIQNFGRKREGKRTLGRSNYEWERADWIHL